MFALSKLMGWRFLVHPLPPNIDQIFSALIPRPLAAGRFILAVAYLVLRELFIKFTMPNALLHMTLNLVGALIVIRFASFYIKSIFWSRIVYVVCVAVIFLRIFKLWTPPLTCLAA